MKRIASIMILGVLCSVMSAQSALQSRIELLNTREPMKSSPWGLLAVRMNGDTLACYNHLEKFVPASNVKLITCGAALHSLGAGYRYETKIAYCGTISDGVLYGDVIIVGGADPTFASEYDFSPSAATVFSQWKAFLDSAGIRSIKGNIVGDPRFFSAQPEHPSWSYEDLGTDYGMGVHGLNFYENVQNFKVAPGAVPGDKVKISPSYPEAPWMYYTYNCTTGKAGTGDELYMYNTDLAPFAEVRGTFAVDRASKTEHFSNRFPALTCAYYFYKYLIDNGMPIEGVFTQADSWTPSGEDVVTVGATYSPRLLDIIEQTLHESDNLFAECLFRTMGRKFAESDSYEASRKAEDEILKALGLDLKKGFQKEDGSGLSRKDYISPDFFVRFLTVMAGQPEFNDYLHTLPQLGEGTLAVNLPLTAKAHSNRIYMKSGSMNGVRCYSGYIMPAGGNPEDMVVFSLLTNNNTAPSRTVLTIIDQILSLL